MKKETLEEAAERLIFKTIGGNYGIMSSDENDQVDGYYNTYEEAYLTLKLKWQHQGYSEEDMIEFDKEKSVVITTMGQKLVRELQSTTQEETIEKIAENESEYLADWEDKDMYKRGFVDGAKYQSERMYSEKDMIEFAIWVYLEIGSSKNKERTNKELFDEWLEQIKKK